LTPAARPADVEAPRAAEAPHKAAFSSAGRTPIAAGLTYLDVPVPGGVTTSALAFATLATYHAGISIAAVRPGFPASGILRVYLSEALPDASHVAWIVMT
jgi:hypothetical protein